MENRVITPYGIGRVIEYPVLGRSERFLIELDRDFRGERKRHFLVSEFQFIKDFVHLFIFDLSGRVVSFNSGQLVSYA